MKTRQFLRQLLLLPKPVSEYYKLNGIQALLVDSAIEWVRRVGVPDDPQPQGLKIVTDMQRSEVIKK